MSNSTCTQGPSVSSGVDCVTLTQSPQGGCSAGSSQWQELVRPKEEDSYPIGLSLFHQLPAFTPLQAYVCVHVVGEYVKEHVEDRVAVYPAVVTVVSLHMPQSLFYS